MQSNFTIPAQIVADLEREYAAALTHAVIARVQGKRWADRLTQAKLSGRFESATAYAERVRQVLEVERAKVANACRNSQTN